MLWLLDWALTACLVLASVFIVAQLAFRPAARRRAAHLLAWIMAADPVIYLASFAIIWPFFAARGEVHPPTISGQPVGNGVKPVRR